MVIAFICKMLVIFKGERKSQAPDPGMILGERGVRSTYPGPVGWLPPTLERS